MTQLEGESVAVDRIAPKMRRGVGALGARRQHARDGVASEIAIALVCGAPANYIPVGGILHRDERGEQGRILLCE